MQYGRTYGCGSPQQQRAHKRWFVVNGQFGSLPDHNSALHSAEKESLRVSSQTALVRLVIRLSSIEPFTPFECPPLPCAMGGRKRAAAPSLVQQSKQLAATHKKQKLASQLQLEREKRDAQRKQAKKKAAARSPYKPHHTLLLIGEGNFSFARSLIHAPPSAGFTPLPGCQVTATCYDSFAVAREKYVDAQDNIDALRAAGARVWDNVDASQLHTDNTHLPSQPAAHCPVSPPSHYDFVIFNFPHTGSGITDTHKNNQQHQQLLTAFLHSLAAAPHLLGPATRVHVTVKLGEPYSSWRVPLLPRLLPMESRDSVRFVTSVPFWPHLYPLYAHRRTIGFKAGLSAEGNDDIQGGAMTHVFMRAVDSVPPGDNERASADDDQLLSASDRPSDYETAADEWSLPAGGELAEVDEESAAADECETRHGLSDHASDAAPGSPTLLLPTPRGRHKLTARVVKSSRLKATVPAKAKPNLRAFLFT